MQNVTSIVLLPDLGVILMLNDRKRLDLYSLTEKQIIHSADAFASIVGLLRLFIVYSQG